MKILIADDHEVVRFAIRQILEVRKNWEVVAEASDGKDAVAKAIETQPDVCIVDYFLPMMNGVEATRQILAHVPRSEILIFTVHDNERLVQDLLHAGARGYLLKSDAKAHLIEAIAALASHRPFFTKKIGEVALDLARPERVMSAITGRERSVVQLIAERRSNKEVARSLEITLKTVETHRATIMRKLQITSSADLVRYAVRNNLVEA